jgi:hypothetical protein
MGTEQISEADDTTFDGKNVRTSLQKIDKVLTETNKYRNSLAIILETAEHIAVVEEQDLEQIKELVFELYNSIDLSVIEGFLS